MASSVDLAEYIRDVQDYPQTGVVFKDISPLLASPVALRATVEQLAEAGRGADGNVNVDLVLGMEARGFILAAPVALTLGVGFVPVRKPGKLPCEVHSVDYELEYGHSTLQIHADAISPGQRVLLVDDVLATGGTLAASRELVERAGGVVAGVAVLMELDFLGGRALIDDLQMHSLLHVG